MSLSFVAEALRSQASAEEKQKALSKMFAEDTASRLAQMVAQSQMQRGAARRGREAASRSAGASAMDDIDFKKTRRELRDEIDKQSELSFAITTGSKIFGEVFAFAATQADDAAKKEAETNALKEAQASEEAAMLTDYRKPGEEYSPSMLRDPGAVREGQEFNSEDLPDAYLQIMPGVDKGYRDTGLTATEFKAERDAYRAEKATESLLDELVEDEDENSFLDELIKEKELEKTRSRREVEAQNRKRGRASLYDMSALDMGGET